jgi:hypothetical protein
LAHVYLAASVWSDAIARLTCATPGV